ncbi:MAG: hypothetical protein ACLQSR_18415 [Limisphaerales bacterium]
MKFALICSLSLILVGCSHHGGSSGSVQNILSEAQAAASNSVVNASFSGRQYLDSLSKIDVSGCPADFQTAWSSYVAAWGTFNYVNPKGAPLDVNAMEANGFALSTFKDAFAQTGNSHINDGTGIEQAADQLITTASKYTH